MTIRTTAPVMIPVFRKYLQEALLEDQVEVVSGQVTGQRQRSRKPSSRLGSEPSP